MSTSLASTKSTPSGNSSRMNDNNTPTAVQRASRSTSVARGKGTSRDASNASSPTSADQIKKIPPIKAPVGLAKGPELQKVSSKIGSLSNIKHRPAGGEKKIPSVKLEWNASSKIGSLDNASHKPRGGDVVVPSQKLQWNTSSKVGSLANIKHKAGGGKVQIFDEKYGGGRVGASARSASEVRPPNNRSTPVAAMQSTGSDHQEESHGKNAPSGDKSNGKENNSSSQVRAVSSQGEGAPASKASAASSASSASSSKTSAAPQPATRRASSEQQNGNKTSSTTNTTSNTTNSTNSNSHQK